MADLRCSTMGLPLGDARPGAGPLPTPHRKHFPAYSLRIVAGATRSHRCSIQQVTRLRGPA